MWHGFATVKRSGRYTVNEMFYSLQGEGARSGRAAIFIRLTGCNLWSGREEDRATAICKFCDTNFLGGQAYETPAELVQEAARLWPSGMGHRYVVLTGGEPTLQVDTRLVDELRDARFEVAMETNGTRVGPDVDWLTLSPKAGTKVAIQGADEVKIVFPQEGLDPLEFAGSLWGQHYLQPMDGPNLRENTTRTIDYIKRYPLYRLSLQTHKLLGIR